MDDRHGTQQAAAQAEASTSPCVALPWHRRHLVAARDTSTAFVLCGGADLVAVFSIQLSAKRIGARVVRLAMQHLISWPLPRAAHRSDSV